MIKVFMIVYLVAGAQIVQEVTTMSVCEMSAQAVLHDLKIPDRIEKIECVESRRTEEFK